VFGEIDGVARELWLSKKADASSYRDWPSPAALPDEPVGVGVVLRDLQRSRHSHFELEHGDSRMTLRALLHAETDYWWQTLALVLREAAALGARGTVLVLSASELGFEPPLRGVVYRLELDGKGSRVRKLRGAEKKRVQADPQLFATVMAIVAAEGQARPRSAREQARAEATARGAEKAKEAAEKRQRLGGDAAARALLSRAKKPFNTAQSGKNVRDWVTKILADPSETAEQSVARAWRLVNGRANDRYLATGEYRARSDIGKALCRLGLVHVKDAKLRAKVHAAIRKEFPDDKQLREAVKALEKARRWPQ
jgi:hypothetical protein